MKAIWSALGVAVAIAGCENRNTDRTYATHTGESQATAQNDMQNQMQDAQKQLDQAQSDANKKAAEAQQEANEKKADATDQMRDARAAAGQTVTVTGTVSDVNDDSFKMKAADGKIVSLDFKDDQGNAAPVQHEAIKEGDQVRASYTERDGDKVLQNLQVIQPSNNK